MDPSTPEPLLEPRTLTLTDLPDPSVVTSFADGCEEICFEDEEEFVCVLGCPRTRTATRSPGKHGRLYRCHCLACNFDFFLFFHI